MAAASAPTCVELTFSEVGERLLRWLVASARGDQDRAALVALDLENRWLRDRHTGCIAHEQRDFELESQRARHEATLAELAKAHAEALATKDHVIEQYRRKLERRSHR